MSYAELSRDERLSAEESPDGRDQWETVCVFRVLKPGQCREGEVVAIFPEVIHAAHRTELCGAYMHVGQHFPVSPYAMIEATRPATPAEYEGLRKELEQPSPGFGYRLKIQQRISRKNHENRRRECDRLRRMQ